MTSPRKKERTPASNSPIDLDADVFFRKAADGIVIVDSRGRYLDVNDRFCSIVGRTREELLTLSIADLFPPGELSHAPIPFEEAQRAEFVSRERSVSKKDGSIVWVEISINAYTEGTLVGFVRDITQRKTSERSLLLTGERLRKAQEIAQVGNWELDLQTKTIWGSEGAFRIYGLPRESEYLPYLKIQTIADPEFRPSLDEAMHQLVEHGTPYDMEFVIRRLDDGERRWIHSRAEVITNSDGVPRLIMGVLQDITERKAADRALQESEELHRKLVTTVPDLIIRTDLDGHVVYINEEGFPYRQHIPQLNILGRSIFEFIEPTERDQARAIFLSMRDRVIGPREYRISFGEGNDVECEINGNVLTDASGAPSGYVYVVRDISERKTADLALRASLREKEILLKEIHHRVKNNLQIISSLINMQAETFGDPAVKRLFRDTQQRIRTMALVHERLYRSGDFSRVDIGSQTRELTHQITRSYGRREITTSIEAESVFVGIDIAIPIGLILNELITNAFKHAFPDERTGSVQVELRGVDGNALRVLVRDDGIGFAASGSIREMTSLGMTLLCALTDQLEATLAVEAVYGTTFTLTVPM